MIKIKSIFNKGSYFGMSKDLFWAEINAGLIVLFGVICVAALIVFGLFHVGIN
jgi:hypothetical protein